MKLGEKKVLQTITENIEMELFSSEERCVTVTIQKREEDSFEQRYRYLEHPLAPDCEEDLEQQIQDQAKVRAKPPVLEEPLHCPHVIDLTEDTEMEMESFPPLRLSDIELVEIKSGDPSMVTPPNHNKVNCVKWKRVIPKKTGLVVKDVVCLPRAHYMAQLEGQLVSEKKHAPLAAMGLSARITIDYSWSAYQMESRLAFLFRGWFIKKTGQRFSFTYLQCVQGSRALFVPDTPAEGWTGEHVLRISGHGALYVLSHHDYPQVDSASDTSAVNSSESIRERDLQLVRHIHPHMGRKPERLTLNLDTLLRLYRQDNENGDAEICIQARRGDVLHNALKAVRKPGFCFRSTPVISFTEETEACKEPVREFFRLSLLELQQSCVFEGHPGRLFLTYDLTALEDGKYYEAGVLIGWSLAQGGPGPCCLHPVFYQLLCCQSPSLEDFNEMDIVDAETQNRLQQLRGCSDVKLLSPGLCDWVSCCGIPRIHSACSDEIPAIYDRLVKHYIYHRAASMISQFIAGLNSCGRLWDLVKSHWEMFLPIMTSMQQQHPLTLEEFKQLFTVCYSHPDSDLRAAEEATVLHWETILTMVSDCQVDFSLQDLLIFITGAHQLPPLGFPKPLSLCFYSQDETLTNVRLPHVSMSSLELFLPRGVAEVADLLVLMNRALQKAVGLTHLTDDHGDHEMDADFQELESC